MSYCDVTGRQTRLPLKLKGSGLGPKLRFSFDDLDIQNVFVNSPHAYEVSCTCHFTKLRYPSIARDMLIFGIRDQFEGQWHEFFFVLGHCAK